MTRPGNISTAKAGMEPRSTTLGADSFLLGQRGGRLAGGREGGREGGKGCGGGESNFAREGVGWGWVAGLGGGGQGGLSPLFGELGQYALTPTHHKTSSPCGNVSPWQQGAA